MEVQTTPVVKRPASLRRSVLVQNTLTPSPMRRSTTSGTSPVVLLESHDEENERSRRRSAVTMQKRLSTISAATSSPLVELNRVLNEKDVNEHLQVCNKLYSENRISSKNAWELYIIDVLKQYISSVAAGGNQMQVASTALDISGKVYGLRVDDVHTVGMKLASSMNSKQAATDKGDSDGEYHESGATKSPRGRKKKKKCIIKKNTLDKEGTSLFGPMQNMDSVFFSTRENVECGATENLLTLKLMHHPSGHRFMKLGKEKCWMTEPDSVTHDPEIKQKKPFELPKVSRFILCQPFQDFDVVEWDPNAEVQHDSLNNDIVVDDKGLPIPDLDGSIHNIFEDCGNDDGGSGGDDDDDHMHHQEEAMEVQRHNGGLGNLVEILPEEYRFPSEYGYNALLTTSNGKVIDRIWAGPSHWKVKYIRRAPARYSGTVVAEPQVPRRKRPEKMVEALEFTLDEDAPRLIDLSKIVNTKKTLSTTHVDKITLPVVNVHLLDLKQTLMSKAVVPKKHSTAPPIEGEVPAYNYDNPNDSEYCSQNGADDNNDDNGADEAFEDNVAASQDSQDNFLDGHLVNEPETVAKSTIAYALKAKKMDMRKLKTAVWQDLTHKLPNLKQPENFDGTVHPTTFSSLYTTLPHYLTTDMKKEVTCPLAFVALLHLCNEQNLKLEPQVDSNFANFSIRKVSKLHE